MRGSMHFTSFALAALLGSSAALADVGGDYGTQTSYAITLPAATSSYFTVFDAFDGDASAVIDGYALAGRLIAATDRTIYLQKNYGASVWIPIATIDVTMDPSFLKVAPGGATIALGSGYYKPLYLAATSALSVVAPPSWSGRADVKVANLDYYDAAWREARYLFINSGAPAGSQVYAIDASLADPGASPIPIIDDIPGASAGLTFDRYGNFITGIGYGADTGQLKVWPSSVIEEALGGGSVGYEDSGYLLADGILSAASLGVDADNNLYVGGGDYVGGSDQRGFAALVGADAIARVLAGGAPVDESDPNDYGEIAPDPCRNDDSTRVQYVSSLKMLVVSANMASAPPDCAPMDYSGPGAPPAMQLYFPPDAPDSDGDGIPDGADNAYLTPNPDQLDSDGDGFGDKADLDFDNNDIVDAADLAILVDAFRATLSDPNYDPRVDLDDDGEVGWSDYDLFLARWGATPPFY